MLLEKCGKEKSGKKESPLPMLSQQRKIKAINAQAKCCIVNKRQRSGGSPAQGLPHQVRYKFM